MFDDLMLLLPGATPQEQLAALLPAVGQSAYKPRTEAERVRVAEIGAELWDILSDEDRQNTISKAAGDQVMDETLKPCPFCGSTIVGELLESTEVKAKLGRVGCGVCGAEGPCLCEPSEYTDQWNRRPDPADAAYCDLVARCQAWKELARARENVLAGYRLAKTPGAELLDTIDQLKAFLAEE